MLTIVLSFLKISGQIIFQKLFTIFHNLYFKIQTKSKVFHILENLSFLWFRNIFSLLIYLMFQETMMLHTPLNPPIKDHHSEYQVHNTEFKMPSRKEKESLLKRYAKKLGLNDRGCYLAVGLAVIAFLLLLVIIIMAVCWPGQ